MTEVRLGLLGLVVLGGLSLAACDGETDDNDAGVWQSPASVGDAGGGATGGVVPVPAGNSPGAVDAGPRIPGTMPLPPDASVLAPADASVPARSDASTTASADGSIPTKPVGGAGDISSCTPPPAGSSDKAIEAWTLLNKIRLAAGAGCMNMVATLNASAQAHCDYRATNRSNAACTADAHTEISGCPGFTGADVQSREIAAGYPRQLAYTEVALTYGNSPAQAIPGWLVTPFHRIPMMDPWTTDMGWGGGPGCDVMDIGRGSVRPPDSTVGVYPYDGETDVPVSFNGLEAPAPPQPAGGWPSSYPVSIYAQRLSVTEHVLTKDGTTTPLEHVWLDTKSPGVAGLKPYFTNTAILYGAPFEPNTKYHVKVVGTYAGGALNVEWSFTTGAKRPLGF